ncbi:heme-thiolate peroxidase [Auriculariales sp. MPI-PUGE-AT-0066]|nr:heme-thiolate peroxidase [Auriculariales sp. MPI-PUGE-AT-0066]
MHISSPFLALTAAIFAPLAQSMSIHPYDSLAGRSDAEVAAFARSYPGAKGAVPVPPPIKDTHSKLVNDAKHPYKSLKRGDARGPCPGLNTLASHGYLPRDGVATPGQIVTAVQEGFNMGWDLATFVTYAAMLVDGNHVSNLMSIGEKTPRTGADPPKPAIVGGLNTHGVFEGDASLTRGDAFFGDNHSFNSTLFQKLIGSSNTYGGGWYNLTAASELRFHRIQESLASNPEFFFSMPRYVTAYAESAFPIEFFVDGRSKVPIEDGRKLNIKDARSFFKNHRMPKDFHRREGVVTLDTIGVGFFLQIKEHPVMPGWNTGTVGNITYVEDPSGLEALQGNLLCVLYNKFVNTTLELYPSPKGLLRKSVAQNLANFFLPLKVGGNPCEERFPYN